MTEVEISALHASARCQDLERLTEASNTNDEAIEMTGLILGPETASLAPKDYNAAITAQFHVSDIGSDG